MNSRISENLDKYVHVHADCIPVKGVRRSAFYDLTRAEIILFPSSYYDILDIFKTQKLGAIINDIEDDEQKGYFMEFMEFLLENELIMFVKDSSPFPPIQEAWDTPHAIQNAIIDVDKKIHDFGKIFRELDALGCEYVQIRSFSNLLKIKDWDEILSKAYHTSIEKIELLLRYDGSIADKDYVAFMEKNFIISSLIIHSSPRDKEVMVNYGFEDPLSHVIAKSISFTEEHIHSKKHCGIINTKSFSYPSVSSFFENKFHNGCLNRKISVDSDGYIRNCPSMPQSYGNANDTSLEEVLSKKSFKEVWNLHKDQIETCQVCEFRYVCTDCRAYLENPENQYSKPLKCGYNPHTNEWEEWSANPLKQKAMKYYEM